MDQLEMYAGLRCLFSAGMITIDMQPLLMDVGFNALMAYLEPDYRMPGLKTATARMEKLYNDSSACTKHKLSNTTYVVTDDWTSMNMLSYITASSHNIDDRWDMKSHVETTENMEEWHTAQNLKTALTTIIAEWVEDSRKVSVIW